MLKLNIDRVYKYPVSVRFFSEDGKIQSGSFTAVFNIIKQSDLDDKKGLLIDKILKSVEGIELGDDLGNLLVGDELLAAVKNDSDLAASCVEAFNESIEKKRTKEKT